MSTNKTSDNYDCQECGKLCNPREFHPYWHCVLFKAGQLKYALADIEKAKDTAIAEARKEEHSHFLELASGMQFFGMRDAAEQIVLTVKKRREELESLTPNKKEE